MKKISKLIIQSCLRVREGEMIRISSWGHTMDLASKLAIDCFKNGAVPLITLMTDQLFEEALTEAPVEVLGMAPKHELAIANEIDACITISGPADPSILEKVPQKNFHSYREAGTKIIENEKRRKVRHVNVHLGKVTKERAQAYRLEYSTWKKAVENALLINYEEMKKIGERLSELLVKGDRFRLVTEQGTDLIFQVDEKFIQLDDGIVSDEDVSRGQFWTNLPAGILDAVPIEGSVEGTVIVDTPQLRLGKIIEKTHLEFHESKLTSISAEQHEETLEKALERICVDRPILSRIGFGLNPNMEPGYLFDEIRLGTVSIAVGGKQQGCVVSGVLQRPTVYIDAKKLLVKGVLKI
ncbi:MAG: aminopeptidase [Candidatus Hermodarchaeota archaeon]